MKVAKCMLCVLIAVVFVAVQAPNTGAEQKPVELIFASQNPEVASMSRLHKKWGQAIEEKSGGKVKFVYYFGGGLLKQTAGETIRGVQGGVAHVAYNPISYRYGFFLNSITELPFLGWTTPKQKVAVYDELRKKFPEMTKEFGGLRAYGVRPMNGSAIHTVKKAVNTPADLKGLKFYSPPFLARYLTSLGGALVDMNIGEWFTSLNSGLIGGIATNYEAMFVFKCLPLTPYHTNAGEAGFSSYFDSLVINAATLEGLPPEARKAFDEMEPWFVEEMIKMDQAELANSIAECKKLNHTFKDLSAEELKPWAEAAKPMHDQWVQEIEAKGLPAKAVYSEAQRLIAGTK